MMRLLIRNDGIDKEYNNIDDIPQWDGYTIVLFDFPDTPGYYLKKYVNDCMKSWQESLKKVRYLVVLVDDEVMGLSRWSQMCNGNKKFITDSLRLYFVNKFNNAVYLDTDVLLTRGFDIEQYTSKNDNFVFDYCTGTFLWNKNKDSEVLNDFFDYYNVVLADEKDVPFWENSDIVAYSKFTRYRLDKGLLTINTLKRPDSVVHFSCFYSWIRDKENIVLILQKWMMETTKWKENVRSFPIESFWPLIHYLDDQNINPPLAFYLKETDKAITFHLSYDV